MKSTMKQRGKCIMVEEPIVGCKNVFGILGSGSIPRHENEII